MPRRWDASGNLIEDAPKRRWDANGNLVSDTPDYQWYDTLATGALRVVPSVAGAMGAAALAAPTGPGALVAGAAGGAAGAGLGETAAQEYEIARGLRKGGLNYKTIAVETGLGAIPIGKGKVAYQALKGAGMGLAGTTGRTLAEEDRMPTLGEAAGGAVVGGALGGGMEALAKWLRVRKGPQAAQDAPGAPISAEGGVATPDTELPHSQAPAPLRDIVAPPRHNAGFGESPLGRAVAKGETEVATPVATTGLETEPVSKLRELYTLMRGLTPAQQAAEPELITRLRDEIRRRADAARAGAEPPSRVATPESAPTPFAFGDTVAPEGVTPRTPVSMGLHKEIDPATAHPGIEARAATPGQATAARQVIADNLPEVEAASRGQVPLADMTTGGEVNLLAKGQNFASPEAAGTAAQAEGMLLTRLNELAAKKGAGTLTDAEATELAHVATQYPELVINNFAGRAEWGRTGRVLQVRIANKIVSVPEALVAQAVRLKLSPASIGQVIVEGGHDLDAGVRALRTAAAKETPFLQKLASYMTGNMLMGPKTQERNIVGNVTNLLSQIGIRPLQALAERMRVGPTGAREVLAGETAPSLQAAAKAIPESWESFWHVLKKGYAPGLTPTTGGMDIGRIEFAGGVANPWNLVGRLLEGTDVFFRQVATDAELAGRLYTLERTAAQRGLEKGSFAWDKAVADARAAAEQHALRATAQEKPGPIAGGLMRLKAAHPNAAPLWQALLPFVKTPANLLRQGLEWTPAGFVMKGANASQVGSRAAAEVQARAAAGTIGMVALWGLAANGQLSGNGPKDPAEKARLYESGWRPNSVKIGDAWYSYGPLQPVAIPMTLVANAWEQWQEQNKTTAGDPVDPVALVGNTMLGAANSIIDQSFLSGVSSLVEALQDPQQYGKAWASRTAQTLVPMSGLVRSLAQTADPTIRRPETVAEGVTAMIPGASTTLNPRLDRFGQPVQRVGGPLNRMFNIFEGSPEVSDPVAEALAAAGKNLKPAAPVRTLLVGNQEVALNRDDAFALGQAKGQALYALLKPVIERPGFKTLSKEQQKQTLDRLLRRSNDTVSQRARGAVAHRRPLVLDQLVGRR